MGKGSRVGFGYYDKGGRSRNRFTQNSSRIWGHCEEQTRWGQCIWSTMYRCDKCHNFVCSDHQKLHRAECSEASHGK